MSLRPYQLEAIDMLIPASFKAGHRRIIRVAPTGSGKSHEIAEMVSRAHARNRRVLLLTHRTELFKSTLSRLNSNIPVVSLDANSPNPIGDYRVVMAMEATIWNRIRKGFQFLPFDLIIADEAHFNNFSKILDHFDLQPKQPRVIGFTATPQGKHLHKIYTDLIENVAIPDLIRDGYLAPCKAFQMQDIAEVASVKLKAGEFEESDLFRHFDKAKLYDGLLTELRTRVPGEKGIVFCINIDHTVKTHATLLGANLPAFMAHSGNASHPAIRQFDQFESHPSGILVNSGIATTGYDCPEIKWVALMRATTSTPLFLQMIGRGSRPYPNKPHFTVMDFGRNHERHGLWSQPREWSLKPPRAKTKLKAAPMKDCPGCGALLPASARRCEYCQHEFPKPTHELKEGIMVAVHTSTPLSAVGLSLSELTVHQLADCQRTKRLKPTLVWRVLRSRQAEAQSEHPDHRALATFAALMGYRAGWIFSQRKKIEAGEIGYKNFKL